MDRREAEHCARAFVAENLASCCAELLAWNRTGILSDGRLREAAALCAQYVDRDSDLSTAERLVQAAALEFAAAKSSCDGSPTNIEKR